MNNQELEDLEELDNEKLLDDFEQTVWDYSGYLDSPQIENKINLMRQEIMKRLNGEYRDWRED